MNILIIGSTGNISYRLVSHALSLGWRVATVSRGSSHSGRRKISHPNKIDYFFDINDANALGSMLAGQIFDIVVDFICYDGVAAQQRFSWFYGRVGVYVFISTTALYSRNPEYLPYTEDSPIGDLEWDYCKKKVEAEGVFSRARYVKGFPVVIARLAHTYDTVVPVAVGPGDWTVPQRILNGKSVIVHGDGTSIWTLTHSINVCDALIKLCLSTDSVGEVFNVVSGARYTWNDVTVALFEVLNMPVQISYISSRKINEISPYLGNGIIGHKMWNDFYDNQKLVRVVGDCSPGIGVEEGLKMTIEWYKAESERQHISSGLDAVLDRLCLMSNFTYYG